jgi:hypothetical protein
MAAGSIEQHLGAKDIGPKEYLGIRDGPVHMGLGGKMNQGINGPCGGKGTFHCVAVTDVGPYVDMSCSLVRWKVGQIVWISRVGHQVNISDVGIWMFCQNHPHEVASDKAQTTRDQ